MPWPWLRALALAAICMPRPWQLHAHGVLPWPWLLHAHALATACPWGAALALAAARSGQAVGIPGACPRARHATSPRIVPHSSKIGLCLFQFLCP